jgi:hypothetical protein
MPALFDTLDAFIAFLNTPGLRADVRRIAAEELSIWHIPGILTASEAIDFGDGVVNHTTEIDAGSNFTGVEARNGRDMCAWGAA